MSRNWWSFWSSKGHNHLEEGHSLRGAGPHELVNPPRSLDLGEPSQDPLLALDSADSYSATRSSVDYKIAISPKSIQMLEEVEIRTARRAQRRRLILGFCAVVFVILISLLAILYPRDTRFNIDSFDVNADNTTYYDGDQLMTNWISHITVENNNFFPISVREIDLLVFLGENRDTPIGKGRGKSLYFSARGRSSSKVDFQMPVYAPSSGKPNLIGECMSRDKVDLYIQSEVDLSWTHWTGHRIPMAFPVTVDCKIPSVGFAKAGRKTLKSNLGSS